MAGLARIVALVHFLLIGETEDGDRVMLPVQVCSECGTPVPTTIVSMDQHSRSAHREDPMGPGS